MKTVQQEYVDCIALKRSVQKEISAETRGMTPLERLAHYRKLADQSPFAPLLRGGNRVRRTRAKK